MNISECAKLLISILPSDWEKVVFSLFIRKCVVNGQDAFSKEFQCKCTAKSINEPIDLVSFYEDNIEMEDILFSVLDFFYQMYKEKSKDNFIIFKLCSDGSYEIKTTDKLENDIKNSEINDIVLELLNK